MRLLTSLALATALGLSSAAFAHSVADTQRLLGDREKFFQPLDKNAPAFALQDSEGRAVRLADLRGKVVVLHFIYASCPDVCPLHAEKLAEIQAMVNQTPMKDQVQFVSITTDPKRDTAEVLRGYGPAHGLDPANWVFLTARPGQPEDATRQLVEAYGHKFLETEDGNQVHSIVTHVIDRQGRWRANFHGLRFEPTNLVVFINALVNEAEHDDAASARGLWDRVRELFSGPPWRAPKASQPGS